MLILDSRAPSPRAAPQGRAALWLALALAAAAAHGGVAVSVRPGELFVGETGQLEVASDEGKPQRIQLPRVEGLDWVGGPSISFQSNTINGRHTRRDAAIYLFRCNRAGTFTVPAVSVELNGRTVRTEPVTVTAKPRQYSDGSGRKLGAEDLFFADVHLGTGAVSPAQVYVGQEIPARVEVYAWENLQPRFEYPEPELDNATLNDYADANPQNRHFAPAGVTRRIVGDVPYQTVSFETAVIPLAVGDLAGRFTVRCQLSYPRERRSRPGPFGDEFFEDFFGRQRNADIRQLVLSLPPVKVAPVPPPPADAGAYVGLLGDWRLDFSATPGEVRVGEPLTLTLRVRGKGNLETLKAPALDLPGYRTYEPEVRKTPAPGDTRAEVTWVLIPLDVTAQPPALKLATFDADTGTYKTHAFAADVRVLPAAAGASPASAVFSQAPTDPDMAAQRQRNAASSILYIKPAPGRSVALPLWRNALWPGLAMCLVGVVAYGGLAAAAARRDRGAGDDAYRRRRQAQTMRRRVFRSVRAARPGQEAAVVREQVVPYASALLNLPPGTTASALADALDPRDPELAAMLRSAAHGDFAPGAGGAIDTRKLLERVARLAALVLLLAAGTGIAADTPVAVPAPAQPTAASDFETAKTAYDRGDYQTAADIFAALRRTDADNPRLLYNQANCAFQLGESARALALYERVRRLAPRDSDNLENLNYVRSNLGLPRTDKPQNPRQLLSQLRDKLRPDEWLLVAAAAILFGGAGAGWRRWRRQSQLPVLAVAGTVLLVALLAVNRQLAGTYRRGGHGVVANAQVTAYQLPNSDGRKADFILPAGACVTIEETRTDWFRIRLDDAEGWIRRDGLEPVW
ncbi:MAG: hypothetical protein BWZ02_01032 [Lentisphaerae bacterium ADurb.BinA184]|nr:MAG: hypothetical protein BWZ02_01032 [Lentisphaerae bacterium ADurb.BinA184]